MFFILCVFMYVYLVIDLWNILFSKFKATLIVRNMVVILKLILTILNLEACFQMSFAIDFTGAKYFAVVQLFIPSTSSTLPLL